MGVKRFGKPCLVIEFDVEVRTERVVDRSVAGIGVTQVRPVDGFGGSDDGGK